MSAALEHRLGLVQTRRDGEVDDDEQVGIALIRARTNEGIRSGEEAVQARHRVVVCEQVRYVLALPVLGDELRECKARTQGVAVRVGVRADDDLGRSINECRHLRELLSLF